MYITGVRQHNITYITITGKQDDPNNGVLYSHLTNSVKRLPRRNTSSSGYCKRLCRQNESLFEHGKSIP
jgi:hypothetical protein